MWQYTFIQTIKLSRRAFNSWGDAVRHLNYWYGGNTRNHSYTSTKMHLEYSPLSKDFGINVSMCSLEGQSRLHIFWKQLVVTHGIDKLNPVQEVQDEGGIEVK